MSTYNVVVQENKADRAYLLENKYNLAVAKSIVTGGTTVCNTIYQGGLVGPTINVSWEEVFGVNFVLSIQNPGAKVSVSGIWQPLELGEGYKLDNGGGWVANSGDPNNKSGFLNVLNEYNANVRIVIGTQDQVTGEWSPIFFSESSLVMAGYGAYQPSEEVQLWYGNDQNPGYVIAMQQTPVKTYTYESTDPHYFYYNTVTGVWFDQSTPYSPSDVGKELGDPVTKLIVFAAAVTSLAAFVTDFRAQMNSQGWEVSITAKTPANIEFSVLVSKKNKDDNGSTDPVADMNTSLLGCKKDGTLPKNESWQIR
ncbi:hypothetical protein EK21DRAFT_112506 [Setomelanomma holmii]|uniref:Uncharacterized protein n=1 Tax=Setomelanomma holmii TaxID=210430 RepID=A0A9P4H812_9PLEO|nr:hypothetical protein EK21DRAFT_112506 [Setomelanomma holmii]